MSSIANEGDRRHESALIRAGDALAITSVDGTVLVATQQAIHLFESYAKAHEGVPLAAWFEGEAKASIEELTRRIAGDVDLHGRSAELALPGTPPLSLDVHVRRIPADMGSGGVLRWSFRDMHTADRPAAIDSGAWAGFLADAGLGFLNERSLDAVVEQIVSRAVPRIADWCALDLLEVGDFYLRRAGVAYSDPNLVQSVQSMRRRYPITSDFTHPVVDVILTGEPAFIPRITDEHLRLMTRDDTHFEFIKGLGLHSSMILPLKANDRVAGAITFTSAESRREYGQADVDQVAGYVHRAELAIDVAQRIERAEQTARINEHYLSIASHELRTPLAVIGGFASLLLAEVEKGSPDPERARVLGRELQTGIERLEVLIEDLLGASSIGQAESALEPSEIDLGELVDEVIQRIDVINAAPGSHRIERLGADGITGFWDADLLDRALSNLLSNAVKYSPDGSDVKVVVNRLGATHVRLEVIDQGIGISEEDINLIFQPFARGAAARRMSEGTGLGLYITRQIVEQHGGAIGVESALGAGSTFTIVLPLQDGTPAELTGDDA